MKNAFRRVQPHPNNKVVQESGDELLSADVLCVECGWEKEGTLTPNQDFNNHPCRLVSQMEGSG